LQGLAGIAAGATISRPQSQRRRSAANASPAYSQSVNEAAYDEIGRGYAEVRRPDPRIAARIEAALGDARSVLNVGAGTGSYEPTDREVTAVEPSAEMIAQRPVGSAPVVQASAEALPFEDDSFDAAMAIITVHHWGDLAAGLAEMRRVAQQRVVILTFDPGPLGDLWLVKDYFPRTLEIHGDAMPPIEELMVMLPGAEVEVVPVPRLCEDGFFCAIWDRPEMHLDAEIRRGSSVWHLMAPEEIESGLASLRADLESGRWDERHGYLRSAPELDVGLRLVVAELDRRT
jgi:SAM-dependent methyltransferase